MARRRAGELGFVSDSISVYFSFGYSIEKKSLWVLLKLNKIVLSETSSMTSISLIKMFFLKLSLFCL